MELDKRIMSGKKPLDCFDIDKAEQFIGKKGYVTDFLQDFCNLNKVKTSELKTVSHTELCCYFCGSTGKKYFLPVEWVKEPEKKYRAYTLKEFIGDVNLGLEPWITMRPVGTNKESKFLYTGYQETEVGEYICLGCYQFDFISLFKNYEIYINGEWQPFGVKE